METSNDIRTNTALRLFDRNKKGIFKLIKTTRAGATTSLCIASSILHEKCLIVVPSNKIAETTVNEDLISACKMHNLKIPEIVQVYSNHHCYFNILEQSQLSESDNEDDIVKFDMLQDLEALPRRPKCGEECEHFTNCECMQILRSQPDIIVITHAKLTNLMRPRDDDDKGVNADILFKLLESRNIIIDESHRLETAKSEQVLILQATKIGESWIKTFEAKFRNQKYLTLANEKKLVKKKPKNTDDEEEVQYFKYYNFRKIIIHISQILANSQVQETLEASSRQAEGNYNKFLITRPTQQNRLDVIKRKDLISYPGLASEFHGMIINGDALRYGISTTELNGFLKLVNVVNAKQMQATSLRKDDIIKTFIQDAGVKTQELLAKFLQNALDMGDKRIIFTL
jgi:hypothetical protein